MQVNGTWTPTIVAFCCNWCSYAGADLSGTNRLSYPANVKIIRIPCSCRLNPMFILRAVQRGADGVIAPYGQTFSQLEQPLHIISSGCATHGLHVSESLHRRPMTFAAAADACATVSGISFGPWHMPDRPR